MGLTHCPPLPIYAAIGFLFTIIPSALWPSLPMIVPSAHTGTAFGLTSAAINLGLLVSYTIVGSLTDKAQTTAVGPIYYAGLTALGTCAAIVWNVYDWHKGTGANNK
mmetsp:Transcript_39970/g.64844  ORF Transcript_39970/g.64844 Transcript_39970/m.64844 type:complete len:107 (+) Transcript_39970:3352-3672(+)